jgi:DnaJ family protein C protein 17
LVKHPDKNPNNPNAANEFAALQRAYDLLTDEEGRKALDDFLKARAARAERTVIHDKKRARMAEELRKREAAAENLSEEAQAKARLQAEIARMRHAAAEKEAKQRAEAAKKADASLNGDAEQAATAAAAAAAGVNADVADALPRTLKVSWTRPGIEYTSTDLRRIFSVHGQVEDVVLREAKKRKKGSALVVMATVEAAERVAQNVHGELSNPLLVIPLTSGKSNGSTVVPPPSTGTIPPAAAPSSASLPSRPALGPRPAAPLFPAGAKPSTAAGVGTSSRVPRAQFASFSSFQPSSNTATTAAAVEVPAGQDDAAAVRRRQAEERKRLIEQLQQEEEDD